MRFRSRRSAEEEEELPDIEPGSRRLSGGTQATRSMRRPADPTSRALAAASGALGVALDLLRKTLPDSDKTRAELRSLERRLGNARLAEDYERVRKRLETIEVPDVRALEPSDDTLELFHRVVFAVTPLARAAGLRGASADLADLARVSRLDEVDSVETRRLLRALEQCTAHAARGRDSVDLMKLCVAEVIEMLAQLSADETEHRVQLEDLVDQLDHALEVHDLEELRRQLLTDLSALVEGVVRRSRGIEAVSEHAVRSRERVDELEAALETAHDEARTDPLTGLPNRRALDEHIERARARHEELEVGVLAVDLDHFKTINDEHGHATGDLVLCAVAGMLQGALRGDDRAFRVGGEELILLLPGANFQGTRATAERLRKRLELTPIPAADGETLYVTASFGVSVWNENRRFGDALSEADAALYRAKERGRNRVVG